jgi:hypothetical protein
MTNGHGIGIDRRLDIEWLDAVAGQVAAGASEPEIRSFLFRLLDGVVAGGNRRGTACHKTVGVLSRTWVNVAPASRSLRDRGAKLLPTLDAEQRVALHWAMLTAAYPFFRDVATNTGRLLALQGNLALAQLTRRMRESRGDRAITARATRHVVRSMVQWGVIADTDTPGVYEPPPNRTIVPPVLGELLLEALLLRSEERSLPVEHALRNPCFFPFHIDLRVQDLRGSDWFHVHREGLDVDVVSATPTPVSPPTTPCAGTAATRCRTSGGRTR